MESLIVDHKLPSPGSLDQLDAMNCPHVACGYSPIRNASKISVEEHIGLLIIHFGGKSYTIRNALVGELEKLVVKDFNDMETRCSTKFTVTVGTISEILPNEMEFCNAAKDESSNAKGKRDLIFSQGLYFSAFRSHLYHSLDIIFLRGHNLIMALLNEKQCSYHADWSRKLGQLKHSLKFMKLCNTINVGRHRLSCILRLIVALSVFNIVSLTWFILHGLGGEKKQKLLMMMKLHGRENRSTFAILGESDAIEPKHKSSAISVVGKASGNRVVLVTLLCMNFGSLNTRVFVGVQLNSGRHALCLSCF
ncbi:hypothetical protein T459_31262 [Capsicum annuum]|uniref:Uncharacterized protein n=1 Tax=Capsicum annuum TaxID=4072 RepID=A0A2G2YAR2_CAPAN|nr:hypothetical protein T459_31262 [Capsicum annuum]